MYVARPRWCSASRLPYLHTKSPHTQTRTHTHTAHAQFPLPPPYLGNQERATGYAITQQARVCHWVENEKGGVWER